MCYPPMEYLPKEDFPLILLAKKYRAVIAIWFNLGVVECVGKLMIHLTQVTCHKYTLKWNWGQRSSIYFIGFKRQ